MEGRARTIMKFDGSNKLLPAILEQERKSSEWSQDGGI